MLKINKLFNLYLLQPFQLLILLLLVFSTDVLHSQTVTGTITDRETQEPLIGTAIIVKGTTHGTTTDVNGTFSLSLENHPLPVTLVVSYIGYEQLEITVQQDDLRRPLRIRLVSTAVGLGDVVVTESRITERQKESPLTVESMGIIAIRETPSADFYEGLSHLKGVDITSASIGFKIINTRGFNSTSPVRSLQLIDGVDNQAPGLNFSLGNFLGASELDIARVELIVGASSAYFGPNAFNGVINMTTKDPFLHKGLSVSLKGGERNLFEGAFRWAQVLQNREGVDKFAYKLNFFYMRANDWEANNDEPASQSDHGKDNPGGYDAVNRYGDENLTAGINNATSTSQQIQVPGLGRWYRTGYWEKDLVDYNSNNLKTSASLHYRLRPELELIYASNFGTGTTVYQGDNRYSLKNILFFQNRIELTKPDKFFVRAYATQENSGDTYDAVFTAFLLQDASKSNVNWSRDYRQYWSTRVRPKIQAMEGFPAFQPGQTGEEYLAILNPFLASIQDSIDMWHNQARTYADTLIGVSGLPYLVPGTAEFDSVFNSIISRTSFAEGGTQFYSRSSLYHVQGEYKFTPTFVENIVVGSNFRLFRPDSRGTIFVDTPNLVINIDTLEGVIVSDTIFNYRQLTNWEYGAYAGVEKRFIENKLKLNLTARLDKNQNFDFLVSPAASAVYTYNQNHTSRLSFSSAIRNPTLADQYLYYNVGRAILLGNIHGVDSLVTIESLNDYINTQNRDTLVYFDIAPVRPEKVKTIEIGHRATVFNAVYFDATYYFSWYNDFLGYQLGVDVGIDTFFNRVTSAQAYRVSSNSPDLVTTQGFSVAATYYFLRLYSLNGNYSWNVLDKRGSDDPIIPAYNTPAHKFNVGISGRDIRLRLGNINSRNWGFNFNYRWVEGFMYEGSPQFIGFVFIYYSLDGQINKGFPKIYSTVKLGATNLTNNKFLQVYGGPYVGRLAYISIFFDFNKL